MIYPDVKAEAWSLKHSVLIKSELCPDCGIEIRIDIPVIAKDYVGFVAPKHNCNGKDLFLSYIKPISSGEFEDLLEE